MQRVLFTVKADPLGWRVEGGLQPAFIGDLASAIFRADRLARTEHEQHGTPTAVAVHYRCGEATCFAYHG